MSANACDVTIDIYKLRCNKCVITVEMFDDGPLSHEVTSAFASVHKDCGVPTIFGKITKPESMASQHMIELTVNLQQKPTDAEAVLPSYY